jgi:hypothetical protein
MSSIAASKSVSRRLYGRASPALNPARLTCARGGISGAGPYRRKWTYAPQTWPNETSCLAPFVGLRSPMAGVVRGSTGRATEFDLSPRPTLTRPRSRDGPPRRVLFHHERPRCAGPKLLACGTLCVFKDRSCSVADLLHDEVARLPEYDLLDLLILVSG